MKKLCVFSNPLQKLRKGKIYTVDHIFKCSCGNVAYGLAEVKEFDLNKDHNSCVCGINIPYNYPVFAPFRFIDMNESTFQYVVEELITKQSIN
jgi:hypothetical protein